MFTLQWKIAFILFHTAWTLPIHKPKSRNIFWWFLTMNITSKYSGHACHKHRKIQSSIFNLSFKNILLRFTILHYSPFKAVWDWIILLLVCHVHCEVSHQVSFIVNMPPTVNFFIVCAWNGSRFTDWLIILIWDWKKISETKNYNK